MDMLTPSCKNNTIEADEDVQLLSSMGYTQELSRCMGGFSNFAISFSNICILAGGITAFPLALSAAGGASIGIGWPIGALFALIVAASMAQIASAYPTAGGLYHWSSKLGGKGWGWATAWFNLLGIIFVVASVNFGVYDPFFKTSIAPLLGIKAESLNVWHQTAFIVLITFSQAILNSRGINYVRTLTDLSGYLILTLSIILAISIMAYSPYHFDIARLFTFTNFTGTPNSLWPSHQPLFFAFLSGLLLTLYTISGFDASAHTAEETHNAAHNVPKGILQSVLWSALFGYVLICTFVLAMPDIQTGVQQKGDFFSRLLEPLPYYLKTGLSIGIFFANYLCGLACLTSCSRMMYAFARDGGLPYSQWLKKIHAKHRTPSYAIWLSALFAIAATLYSNAFAVLSTGCAVFLYISYIMPSAAGLFAEGKTWTTKGPFNLGIYSKPIALLATLGGIILIYVGIQPPNEKVLYLSCALMILLFLFWYVFGIRHRFNGPANLDTTK